MFAGKSKKKVASSSVPRSVESPNKALEKATTKAEKLTHRYQDRAEKMANKVTSEITGKAKTKERQLRARSGEKELGATGVKIPALGDLTKGASRGSLVSTSVGLAGLLLCLTPLGVLAIISGLFAFISGLQELSSKDSSPPSLKSKGFAVAGIVSGILSIIGALAWLIFFIYWAQSGLPSPF